MTYAQNLVVHCRSAFGREKLHHLLSSTMRRPAPFGHEQQDTIAAGQHVAYRHPVDYRVSIALLFGRQYYVTLLAGPEGRNPERGRRRRRAALCSTAWR